MSCDWNIYCKTCDSTHEFCDANHQRELMVVLIDNAVAITGLNSLVNDRRIYSSIELNTSYGGVDIEWFVEHCKHELVPRNEYGSYEY